MPKRARLYEMLRFIFVGGACFLFDYGLLYVLTAYAGLYYLVSAAVSFTLSVFLNYWLCLVCVFRGANAQSRRAKMLFFGSSIAGLGLNQLLMWSLVDLAHIHYMIAKPVAAGIVMLWNYVLKRRAVLGSV
ncbi:GtrA family protein [Selenomonas sp. F0473]|uniref:GtrA family protein n=1 Tax=Selenomonas sp. F0473 TaxID=999423 RepID=UPI0025F3ED97|nr:GtrA family protein [Selenomonas sp. F0473]